ncbi:MAG: hypothetical protein WBV81_06850 [Ignavibacteriaceae bacterium]
MDNNFVIFGGYKLSSIFIPVRNNCTPGSVCGMPGNRHFYHDGYENKIKI